MASTSREAQENIAQKTWEMENNVQMYSTLDDIYKYDKRMQQEILKAEPWKNDPLYFKEIKISALALLKMIMHARSSRTSEITGFLQGKVERNTMIVIDTFAIPVEDTETKVNAQEQAYDYMIQYVQSAKVVGREERVIGWYHSHPGYGCWLSGVDVDTQSLNQNFQEPFVAIVIDPIRTISAGKVCLEAFRTYPINYKPANEIEYQTQVPLNKTKDFELHRKLYYSLKVSYFKSSSEYYLLNSLWNKYWVNTLSSCSLLTNAGYITTQINDIAKKLKKAKISLYKSRHVEPIEQLKGQNNLMKATQDSNTLTAEILSGFISQTVKEALFNSAHPRIFYN